MTMNGMKRFTIVMAVLATILALNFYYYHYPVEVSYGLITKFNQKTADEITSLDQNAPKERNIPVYLGKYFITNLSNPNCILPTFKSNERCIEINKENGDENCFYHCPCFGDVRTNPPGIYTDHKFPLKSEMDKIEKDLSYDKEFVNIFDTTDMKKSNIFLQTKGEIHVGQDFKVLINLIDGGGRPRRIGGDDIRTRMISADRVFKAAGDVEDLGNGSYIASFKALWEGESSIFVTLSHSREGISTTLKWHRLYRTMFYHAGIFSKGAVSERTACSPFSDIPGYESLCNLTVMNHGQPFYCGEPSKPELKCRDLNRTTDFGRTNVPMNKVQLSVTSSFSESKMNVNVRRGDFGDIMTKCRDVPKRDTWNTKMPSGYFNGTQWISLRCKNLLNKSSFKSCLVNLKIIIMGDSTTRQYYSYLQKIIPHCRQITEKWTTLKWHNPTSCVSNERNVSLTWNPHELPFSDSEILLGKSNLKSTSILLNNLPKSGKIVFIIHYFAHLLQHHNSFFLHTIRFLKEPIRKALNSNTELILAIKSPHAFQQTPCGTHFNDMQARIFRDIIHRELAEFKDSIIYLNVWESTVAINNYGIHPTEDVVWQNLRMLFGYIC